MVIFSIDFFSVSKKPSGMDSSFLFDGWCQEMVVGLSLTNLPWYVTIDPWKERKSLNCELLQQTVGLEGLPKNLPFYDFILSMAILEKRSMAADYFPISPCELYGLQFDQHFKTQAKHNRDFDRFSTATSFLLAKSITFQNSTMKCHQGGSPFKWVWALFPTHSV